MDRKEIINELKKLEVVIDTPLTKRDRGLRFERLIADLFEDEEILIKRPYYTMDNKSEQIDGAIRIGDRVFLLEIKWVESGLAASDLYAFIGKVDNKMFGTLGLFISKEELKNNFINAASKGRQRKVIIIHGKSVENMCKLEKGKIRDYLNSAINVYSFDNEIDYSMEKHLEQKENKIEIIESQEKSDASIKKYVSFICNNNKIDDYLIYEETEKLDALQKNKIFEYLMLNYPKYYKNYSFSNALYSSRDMAFQNINTALNYLKIFEQQNIIDLYLMTITNYIDIAYFLPEIWGKIKNSLKKIDDEKKSKVSNALYQVLHKISGDYDKENIITECIKEYWENIDQTDKINIISEYIEYYYSNRIAKFPQKSFAIDIISTMKDTPTKKAIENWISNKIKKDIEYLDKESAKKIYGRMTDYFSRNYKELAFVLEYSPEEYIKYINEMYIKILNSQFPD